MSDTPDQLRRRMVDELVADGVLTDAWREHFLAVPRHEFIPDLIWRDDLDGPNYLVPMRRADDDEWLWLAYQDSHVVIQVDDGKPAGPGLAGRLITSSASMPSVVAIMLHHLHIEPGMRVLEVGTGTGYNAALLAARLGAANVTTIEIDPEIAQHAKARLATTGFAGVDVVTGDGSHGHAPKAPYDRVISTAACHRVPYGWVAQTQPGGLVLTPWRSDFYHSALLSLAVNSDGTAQGRIVDRVAFMDLRDQRVPRVSFDQLPTDAPATETTTSLHPHDIAGDHDAATAIGIRVPHCRYLYQPPGDDRPEGVLWLIDPWSGSWAALHHDPEVDAESYRVRFHGPRNVLAEIQAAHDWWVSAGRPAADQWVFTITPHGQHIEL